jgi:hypothetical protein
MFRKRTIGKEAQMEKRSKTVLVLLMILLFAASPLVSRPTDGIAIGAQVGALATGVVVDIPLGNLALNVGLNTPLLWTYIASQSGAAEENLVAPFFILSGDLTKPIPLGEHFDLKLGISSLAGTDFETGVIGIGGATAKGEYWIPDKNLGLFMHMDVPLFYYMVSEDDSFISSNWLIPLFGIFTTSAGVLWTF